MTMRGRITKLLGGFYYVYAEDHNTYETRARGIFRHRNMKPVVGDFVTLTLDEGDRLNSVEEILPRKNVVLRPPVANVDQMLVFIPVASPKYNLYLVDKLIAYYEYKEIEIYPVVSKFDLDPEEARRVAAIYEQSGYRVFLLSEDAEASVQALESVLHHKTTALSGVSGAGKSTFLNRTLGLDLETSAVSDKNSRGRHTTRHTEIYAGEEGMYLFDTPGFSSIELSEIPSEELADAFREFRDVMGQCKFQNCVHINEPGCAVKAAVEAKKIPESRYENYVKIYEELSEKENTKWR